MVVRPLNRTGARTAATPSKQRAADYKTAASRPRSAAECCPCSSGRMGRPASALLSGRVAPGGMTSGMTCLGALGALVSRSVALGRAGCPGSRRAPRQHQTDRQQLHRRNGYGTERRSAPYLTVKSRSGVRLRLPRFGERRRILLERQGRLTRFLYEQGSLGPSQRRWPDAERERMRISCWSARALAAPVGPGSARPADPSDSHLWCFRRGCPGHPAGRGHKPQAQQHPALWTHRLALVPSRPEPQVAMTSHDRAQHEPASPVAANGTESDGGDTA
jgi:hypothetical protein